jgi:DeoR/GlpR family transcriptional regulator of sugar metabolism
MARAAAAAVMSSPPPRLSQKERHAQILALLRRDGVVRIATLAQTFDVTTETARRDLDALATTGALQRTYGGGANRSLIDEPGIRQRGLALPSARSRIAAAAAGLVEAGDALLIDAGSTTSLFAAALAARNLHLTVVTNCVPVATALGAADRCRVILCPGEFVPREGGVFGSETVAFLARYRANKAFIGAGGVTTDGVTDADSAACAVKRTMLERAERALLVADSSKFGTVQFERFATLADIDDLVTETPAPRKLDAALKGAGVTVRLAVRG